MNWQYKYPNDMDIDMEPGIVKTPKTYWDSNTQCWKNTTIWSVPLHRNTEDWLKEYYQAFRNDRILGWYKSFNKITMGEKIYLHYCLARPE